MTMIELRALCTDAMATTPHADPGATLSGLRYLTDQQKRDAEACYRAIIGERTLPASFQRHAQPVLKAPLQGRARAVREAQARRILEERRDMA